RQSGHVGQARAQEGIMATLSLGRIVRDVALLALVFSTGFAVAEAKADCPAAPHSVSEQAIFAAAQEHFPAIQPATAAAIPVWKSITIGELKDANAVRTAIEATPCAIALGDWADEILGRPVFPFSRSKRELDLVVISAADLGFGSGSITLR